MYSFVDLGLPDGMIGTAWPAMRHSFGVPLEDIGIFFLAASFGGVTSSSLSGLMVNRLGTRRTLMVGALLAGLGAVVAVAAPVFALLVVAGAFIGVGGGFLDGSVNIAVAMSGRSRLLNLVHGCYGLGTTIGPLLVTGALLAASSWRPAYLGLLVAEAALLGGWRWAGRHLPAPQPPAAQAPAAQAPPAPGPAAGAPARTLRGARLAAVVGLGLFVFLLYTGMEVGAGQWEASFDRGHLHLGTGATGIAVFGYWAALTLVRFALAVPRRPPAPGAIVRWGCLLACAGAAVVWWAPTTVVTLLGFVVVAGALAGVFPALVALTPARVGDDTAHHVIGWQIGAAGVGGSLISALFGVIFQHFGFVWLGPCLLILGLLVFAASEVLARPAISAAGAGA